MLKDIDVKGIFEADPLDYIVMLQLDKDPDKWENIVNAQIAKRQKYMIDLLNDYIQNKMELALWQLQKSHIEKTKKENAK